MAAVTDGDEMLATSNSFTVAVEADSTLADPAPDWVSSLVTNQWTAMGAPNTLGEERWDGTNPTYAEIRRNSGIGSLFLAWAGAAFAPNFGTHGTMLHYCGGHQDYLGNEVYGFDLGSRTWSRLSAPSPYCPDIVAGISSNGIFTDGSPGVVHSAYSLQVIPATNELFSVRREWNILGGGNVVGMAFFDLDASLSTDDPAVLWDCPPDVATLPSKVATGSIYDSTRDKIWAIEGRGGPFNMAEFNRGTGLWTEYNIDSSNWLATGPYVYVPTKDVIVVFNVNPADPTNAQPRIIFPSSPTTDSVLMDIDGTPQFIDGGAAEWSDNLGKIVMKETSTQGAGVETIYTLEPPAGDYSGTWTWETVSTSGSVIAPDAARGYPGDYAKFRVIDYDDATIAVVCHAHDQDYNVIRLA